MCTYINISGHVLYVNVDLRTYLYVTVCGCGGCQKYVCLGVRLIDTFISVFRDPKQRIQLNCVQTSDLQNCEIISGYCLKLYPKVICYAAM